MKIKEYFLHSLAVGFFVSAVVYKSWLLGLCSVCIVCCYIAQDALKMYMDSKQTNETVKSLKQIAEDQTKLQQKFEQWQTELGKVSYRVNQMGDYVGSPRD